MFSGMDLDKKAIEVMNYYAAQGWEVLRTEGIGGGLVVVFVRDRQ